MTSFNNNKDKILYIHKEIEDLGSSYTMPYDMNIDIKYCINNRNSFKRLKVYIPTGIEYVNFKLAAKPNEGIIYAYKFINDDGSNSNIINTRVHLNKIYDVLGDETFISDASNTLQIFLSGNQLKGNSGWLYILIGNTNINSSMSV